MLRRRSSIWLLALIIGSVFAQDVGIIANETQNALLLIEATAIEEESSTINLDAQKETESSSKAPTAAPVPTVQALSIDNSEQNSNDTRLESGTNLAMKKVGNQTETKIQTPPETKTITVTENKKETSRKGTVQFVVNSPTTRYPPHYHTTPYPYPYPPPRPPYYPHYHHHYQHYPPYERPPPPTTSRPWPPYGGYPGIDYGGGYPGGYPYRPPYGYPGYGFGPYGPYGPFGFPWWLWNRTNTNDRSLDVNIQSEIQQAPVKSVPFFSYFGFGSRKK